jgi:cytochrome c biogenesis protein CcdA
MGLLLVLIFIGVFMAKFAGQPISDQIESWAQFGDYIGGILNPFLL